MNLSERERTLAIWAGVVVGALLVYFIVVQPLINRGTQISDDLKAASERATKAEQLQRAQVKLHSTWRRMKSRGEIGTDPFETSNQIIDGLQQWARESQLTVAMIQAEPPSSVSADARADKPESKFRKVTVHMTVDGGMGAMANFLWRVEAVPMVLRVVEIQLSPRKEATDNLQLQLTVATLCPVSDPAGVQKRVRADTDRAAEGLASADSGNGEANR